MMMQDITLIHGDCLEKMQDIPEKSITMILTDLPYGITARNKWDSVIPFPDLWAQYDRIIKDNGAIVLFGSGMFTADLMESNKKEWRYNLIWQKTLPVGFLNANRMPLRSHEDICVFYKSLPVYHPQKTDGHPRKMASKVSKYKCRVSTDYGKHTGQDYDSTERYPTSVWTFAKDVQKEALHPTQKPVALLEELIKTYTNSGDTVLDSCMGSGSTGVACIHTGRKFIGIEKDNGYFRIAEERCMKAEEEKEKKEVVA